MKPGQILICNKTIKNHFGDLLFKKDNSYKVIYVDNEQTHIMICLTMETDNIKGITFPIDFILENFIKKP